MFPAATLSESEIPLAALSAAAERGEPAALALITGTLGAAYRPRGAGMVITASGQSHGTLSSGCIERDVALHARAALADGAVRRLRYGQGSPFLDLQLPCGGGLDILILPRPDLAPVRAAQAALRARRPAQLCFQGLPLTLLPELRFLIFGKGPEARAMASLASAAGYDSRLWSPDPETIQGIKGAQQMQSPAWPEGLQADARTAITLFFHDHELEPPLLREALQSPAFYIGAQGSARAADSRDEALRQIGLNECHLSRLARPFGLIPSARDPRTLALSVLTQVVAEAAPLRSVRS